MLLIDAAALTRSTKAKNCICKIYERRGRISENPCEWSFELWFSSDCQVNGSAGLCAELDLRLPRWVIVSFRCENWRMKTRHWLFTNESNRLMKSGVWITHSVDINTWLYIKPDVKNVYEQTIDLIGWKWNRSIISIALPHFLRTFIYHILQPTCIELPSTTSLS